MKLSKNITKYYIWGIVLFLFLLILFVSYQGVKEGIEMSNTQTQVKLATTRAPPPPPPPVQAPPPPPPPEPQFFITAYNQDSRKSVPKSSVISTVPVPVTPPIAEYTQEELDVWEQQEPEPASTGKAASIYRSQPEPISADAAAAAATEAANAKAATEAAAAKAVSDAADAKKIFDPQKIFDSVFDSVTQAFNAAKKIADDKKIAAAAKAADDKKIADFWNQAFSDANAFIDAAARPPPPPPPPPQSKSSWKLKW